MSTSFRNVTTFCDLKKHRVFELAMGRTHDLLEPFLRGLKGRERGAVVCIDLSSSYRAIVRKYFPNARIVSDRFHVIRTVLHHSLAAFEDADPEEPFVLSVLGRRSNLRQQALRIINRAGLKPWLCVFQNLRSSRETELVEKFPVHVVTSWIGNSPDVANRHYLQTHEEHFSKAVMGKKFGTGGGPEGARRGGISRKAKMTRRMK